MTNKIKTIKSTSFSSSIIQRDEPSEAAWCSLSGSIKLIFFHSREESLLLTVCLIREVIPLSSPILIFSPPAFMPVH